MTQTRIVLADGHEMVREGLRMILEQHPGFEVVGEACDGPTAIEQVEKLAPDVLVAEMWLARLSGIAVTTQILKNHSSVRVVVLTLQEDLRFVEDSLRAGASACISKVCAAVELINAVEAVREGRKYLSPAVAEAMMERVIHPERLCGRVLSALTSRESEILQRLAEGQSAKEIGKDLHISGRTAESHRANLMRKLNVKKTAGLVRIAIREGLVAP